MLSMVPHIQAIGNVIQMTLVIPTTSPIQCVTGGSFSGGKEGGT
jgi:hypothetical protein